jgi:serine/threonine protein kinase
MNCGTHGYRAPETYLESNEGYEGDKADIFSLGVILFILVFGVPPFHSATKDDSFYRHFHRGPNSYKYFFRLHPTTKSLYQNGSLDLDLMDLLLALFEQDP